MRGDLICCNGELTSWMQTGLEVDSTLQSNFIYQRIHTIEHKTLHAKAHLELTSTSYKTLYGEDYAMSVEQLESEISEMLSYNRYPKGSIEVLFYLFPAQTQGAKPIRVLSCTKQLLYKHYKLWHNYMSALVVPYDYPLSQHRTATSLVAHNYAQYYAQSRGFDIALRENQVGELIDVGENPLFATINQRVFTSPIENGATDSVERRLGIAASKRAGWEVFEDPIERSRLGEYDELFYITTQGVVTIATLEGISYLNSAAITLSSHITMI